jgi:hypothetical protein
MMKILTSIGRVLIRMALAIALDARTKEYVVTVVQQIDLQQIDGPGKMAEALREVRRSDAAKELPDLLKTLAIEAAVEQVHKRIQR